MSMRDYLEMIRIADEMKEKRALERNVQDLTNLVSVISGAVNLTPGGAVTVYTTQQSVSIIPGVSTGFRAINGHDYDLTSETVPGVAPPVSYWDAAGQLYQSLNGAMPNEEVQAKIATSLYNRQDLNIGNLLNHIRAQVKNNSFVIDRITKELLKI
ncbi:MAG: hypothetical protein JW791_05435 [Nanoarchaeota archaeon]|nr:hypothetical protein [Nanoarchaeota archaeon]